MTNSIPPDSSQPIGGQPNLSSLTSLSSSFASALSATNVSMNQGSNTFKGPQWNNFNNSANQAINNHIQQAKAPPVPAAPSTSPAQPTTPSSATHTTPPPASESAAAKPRPGGLNLSGPGWDAFDATAKKMFMRQLEQSMSTQMQQDQARAHKASENLKKVIEGDDS